MLNALQEKTHKQHLTVLILFTLVNTLGKPHRKIKSNLPSNFNKIFPDKHKKPTDSSEIQSSLKDLINFTKEQLDCHYLSFNYFKNGHDIIFFLFLNCDGDDDDDLQSHGGVHPK